MPTSIGKFVADVKEAAPDIVHILVGCREFAEQEIAKASTSVPRAKRVAFQRRQMIRWQRAVDELKLAAMTSTPEETLASAARLQYGGLAYARTAEEAEDLASSLCAVVPKRYMIGMHEEIIAPAIAIVWLWRDA